MWRNRGEIETSAWYLDESSYIWPSSLHLRCDGETREARTDYAKGEQKDGDRKLNIYTGCRLWKPSVQDRHSVSVRRGTAAPPKPESGLSAEAESRGRKCEREMREFWQKLAKGRDLTARCPCTSGGCSIPSWSGRTTGGGTPPRRPQSTRAWTPSAARRSSWENKQKKQIREREPESIVLVCGNNKKKKKLSPDWLRAVLVRFWQLHWDGVDVWVLLGDFQLGRAKDRPRNVRADSGQGKKKPEADREREKPLRRESLWQPDPPALTTSKCTFKRVGLYWLERFPPPAAPAASGLGPGGPSSQKLWSGNKNNKIKTVG